MNSGTICLESPLKICSIKLELSFEKLPSPQAWKSHASFPSLPLGLSSIALKSVILPDKVPPNAKPRESWMKKTRHNKTLLSKPVKRTTMVSSHDP